jgi:hypothetical protein
MKIKKQTKILFIISLCLAIIAIGIFLVLFSFMNGQVAQTIQNTDAAKIAISKQETAALMKTDIQDAGIYQKTLSQFILPKNSEVDFIKILESIAASSSVKLQVNSVADVAAPQLSAENDQLVHINVAATGAWNNTQLFLALLETYPLDISITSLSLTKFAEYQVGKVSVPQWSIILDFTVVESQS